MSFLDLPKDLLNIVHSYLAVYDEKQHMVIMKDIRSYGVFKKCLAKKYSARLRLHTSHKNVWMGCVHSYARYTPHASPRHFTEVRER